jgi:hypothetical protein
VLRLLFILVVILTDSALWAQRVEGKGQLAGRGIEDGHRILRSGGAAWRTKAALRIILNYKMWAGYKKATACKQNLGGQQSRKFRRQAGALGRVGNLTVIPHAQKVMAKWVNGQVLASAQHIMYFTGNRTTQHSVPSDAP